MNKNNGRFITMKNILRTLALLSIPLVFLACSEPTPPPSNNGNNTEQDAFLKGRTDYANSIIAHFKGSCDKYTTDTYAHLTTARVKDDIDYLSRWAKGTLRNSLYNYTQSELDGYDARIDTIGDDTLRAFQRNNPGRSISNLLDTP